MAHPPSSANAPSSRSSSKIDFRFLTLFPEIFDTVLSSSLLGKACERKLLSTKVIQIRDFAKGRHRTVDDTPYGGGEGMLLKADVLYAAWKKALPRPSKKAITILLSPQGEVFSQGLAKELVGFSRIVFVCGHYEGVDERFIDRCVDREISIGDYVLTGGELPALVMADAIARLVPGVVGKMGSVEKDSLEGGLLKYPQYTRPREFEGLGVPEVLLSGDHRKIAKWREEQSLERTKRKRPDLLKRP